MAENLNYSYNRGTARSYCYNDDPKNCVKYGRLYTWSAAMDSAALFSNEGRGCGKGATCTQAYPVRGVCPAGWHLPSDAEWNTLKMSVLKFINSARSYVGYALKSTSDYKKTDSGYSGNGSDTLGFGALPAGLLNFNGRFSSILAGAYFWSATASDDTHRDGAYGWILYYFSDALEFVVANRDDALSVRCIMDD